MHSLTETEDRSTPDGSVQKPGWRQSPVLWLAASVAAVMAMMLARLVREPRFLFWDDTQLGAFGQWYGLGSRLLEGQLPILSPGAWQGGNYLAEGQWGIWNPLTWLIALSMHVGDGATVAVTLVKLVFLVALCIGVFLLARAYGAQPWWAAVAGFTATAGGQTIFMDAPSWVTGLQNATLFAFVWWALKRHLDGARGPLPFFVASYLLVTIGYVFGVIELAILLFVFLGFAIAAKNRAQALRVALLGCFPALLTVFVYLPGVLTAPVTRRAGSDILNDLFLNMDLGDLAASPIATGVSSVRGYWGDFLPVPLQYVTWLLPLLVLISAGWRASLRDLRVPLVLLGVTLALVIGPSVVGPLRYPARMMPYVVMVVALLIAVVASRGWPQRVSPRRILVAALITVVSGWLAWAAQPSSWVVVAVGVLIQLGVLFALLHRRVGGRGGKAAAGWLLIASLVVIAPQIAKYPSSPLGNFNVPSSVSAMHDVASGMGDGIFTVGDVYSLQRDPRSYEESLVANLWYTTGKDVASVYTVLPFTSYADQLCVDIRGWTCADALDTLFEGSPTIADDMALNTVVVIKGEGLDDVRAPAGWTADEGEFTWTLHRTDELPRAGGIARVSDGVTVSNVTHDDTSVTFTVDSVAQSGSEVVMSRLAWPGYTVDGAELAAPDRGFLLSVALDPSDVGSTIRVQFSPPGWTAEVAAAALAGVLALSYTLWFAVRARARRRA
ncbi:hypothetical protein LQ938_04185 [Microbacterium sp. cx-55]|uniref:hypothetical protein n=1 Tax=Microbacterium sp. cx-55 TaxID=2875948 RepID=UPI001CBF56F8|nr:hypothetical protein [Microbacterium sp. cx-55]MBZ4487090.1 hypothetical protein [Microbacterium sp. cx-55]UGB36003.1 hypothetical protein LQ938_04185 [Microbacterium sp. cx-55]